MSLAVHTVPIFRFPSLPESFSWSVEQVGAGRVRIQLKKEVIEHSGWLKKTRVIEQLIAEETVDYSSALMCKIAQKLIRQNLR
jgi:hypothetical protein